MYIRFANLVEQRMSYEIIIIPAIYILTIVCGYQYIWYKTKKTYKRFNKIQEMSKKEFEKEEFLNDVIKESYNKDTAWTHIIIKSVLAGNKKKFWSYSIIVHLVFLFGFLVIFIFNFLSCLVYYIIFIIAIAYIFTLKEKNISFRSALSLSFFLFTMSLAVVLLITFMFAFVYSIISGSFDVPQYVIIITNEGFYLSLAGISFAVAIGLLIVTSFSQFVTKEQEFEKDIKNKIVVALLEEKNKSEFKGIFNFYDSNKELFNEIDEKYFKSKAPSRQITLLSKLFVFYMIFGLIFLTIEAYILSTDTGITSQIVLNPSGNPDRPLSIDAIILELFFALIIFTSLIIYDFIKQCILRYSILFEKEKESNP